MTNAKLSKNEAWSSVFGLAVGSIIATARMVTHMVVLRRSFPPHREAVQMVPFALQVGFQTLHRELLKEDDALRQEMLDMRKTMADALLEQGRRDGEKKAAVEIRQQTLVCLLRRRFGKVSAKVVTTVESTTDVKLLDTWLDRLVMANNIDQLDIPTKP
jgi:hypothetical protein